MRAITYERYGGPDVLKLQEIDTPTPKENEVLIKVMAASVTPLDWHFLTGRPYVARIMAGLLKPKQKVLGVDLAGRVEAVGPGFHRFRIGDEVFGMSFAGGAFAEYICLHDSDMRVAKKPKNVSFEHSAALPYAGYTALVCLRDLGKIKEGQEVLINGASGGVGTHAVQIAKSFGTEVTGVCSTKNLELVRSIGAEHVVDYTQRDFAATKKHYDLVFDVARKRTYRECREALKESGIYVTTEFSPRLLLQKKWVSMTSRHKAVPLPLMKPSNQLMTELMDLIETRRVTPVVDRLFDLSQVPEALAYIGTGHCRGKIVVIP